MKRKLILIAALVFLNLFEFAKTRSLFVSNSLGVTNLTVSTASDFGPTPSSQSLTTSLAIGNPKHQVLLESGMINPGFETGDTTGWTIVGGSDSIQPVSVVDTDINGSPAIEGNYMLKIGVDFLEDWPQGDISKEGVQEIYQEFVPTSDKATFAYNIFTADAAPMDKFYYGMELTGNGETIDSYNVSASSFIPVPGFFYSSTGWQIKTFDLSGKSGPFKLKIKVGNTDNNLYPTWVYLDAVNTKTYVTAGTEFVLTPNYASTSYYKIDGGGYQQGTIFNFAGFSETEHQLTYYSDDGNFPPETPRTVLVHPDNSTPRADIEPFVDSDKNVIFLTNSSPLPITFQKEDNDQGSGVKTAALWYKKDGGGWNKFADWLSSPSDFLPSGDGDYEFYAQAEDNLGNQENGPANDTFAQQIISLDLISPVSSISSTLVDNGLMTINFTDGDSFSGVKETRLWYQKDGGGWVDFGSVASPVEFDTALTGGGGTYGLKTIAEDEAGNREIKDPAQTLVVVGPN